MSDKDEMLAAVLRSFHGWPSARVAADTIERITRERDAANADSAKWFSEYTTLAAGKGGGLSAINELRARIATLEAELADRRMCVNCGKYAPPGHDRTEPLPECVDHEGYAACTFDTTPAEAWAVWRDRYYATRKERDALEAENARLREAIKPFSDMAGPYFMANYHDADVLMDPNLAYEGSVKPRLTFQDFRRARAALGGSNE